VKKPTGPPAEKVFPYGVDTIDMAMTAKVKVPEVHIELVEECQFFEVKATTTSCLQDLVKCYRKFKDYLGNSLQAGRITRIFRRWNSRRNRASFQPHFIPQRTNGLRGRDAACSAVKRW
jgi:hypothetical protein